MNALVCSGGERLLPHGFLDSARPTGRAVACAVLLSCYLIIGDKMSEERQLEALKLLESNPELSQRQLSEALGVSLGATNYCLKALVEKGWLKLESFQNNPNKLGYLYLLTPSGISAKTTLTAEFLRRKLIEYETLKREIEALESEVQRSHQ